MSRCSSLHSVWWRQYEACVGVYFPAIGTIRSKFIPEKQRATIMNIFRWALGLCLPFPFPSLYLDRLAQSSSLSCTQTGTPYR
jgi:MFS transporter, MFS domain-containing protein family, molybdate-anion transporter